jgi:hypothetical protein
MLAASMTGVASILPTLARVISWRLMPRLSAAQRSSFSAERSGTPGTAGATG